MNCFDYSHLMKSIILISLMFFFCEMGISQGPCNDDILIVSTTEHNFIKRGKGPDNLYGFDFFLYSISGHYARKFTKGFYIGLEAGILPSYNWIILADEHFTRENTIWSKNRDYDYFNNSSQLYFGHLFIRWRPDKLPLEIDTGFRAAKYTRSVLYVEDDYGFTNFYGAFVKPMVRIWKFSIGGRLDMGNMYGDSFKPSPEFVMIVSPVLRFNFK